LSNPIPRDVSVAVATEVLALDAVSKSYAGRPALASVRLVVREGEVHGLVGNNGAGKTTLLRLALGLTQPDSGAVRAQAAAGFVDAPRLYPYLTGQQNVELLADLDDDTTGRPRDERVEAALGRVRLGEHKDAKVATYSTGMRTKVGIAAALVRSPRVLLLDEPTSSLDPHAKKELRATLRELTATGVGVLLSSHDLTEVLELCDVITVLHATRVVFSGSAQDLRRLAPEDVVSLRTSDDARALTVATAGVLATRTSTGTRTRTLMEEGLTVQGPVASRDEYVLALGRDGVAVREMRSVSPSLESFFFSLTGASQPPETPEAAESEQSERTGARRRPGWSLGGAHRVMRVERKKLLARPLALSVLGACLAGPFVFALVIRTGGDTPDDTLFGRGITRSGFALPLVVLGFAAQLVFPALAAVVGGDIFSSEDRFGTWSTLLTRSRSLVEIFLGKLTVAFAFSCVAVAVLGASSVAAGAAFFGVTPLVSLSGTLLPPDRALLLVALAWASTLLPALAFTALAALVSIVTRSSAAGVGLPVALGLAMQLASLVPAPEGLHRAWMTSAFTAWHGLLAEPRYTGALVTGALVSLGYVTLLSIVAARALSRREPGA
jgi:ABC-2 type transport system permease protein